MNTLNVLGPYLGLVKYRGRAFAYLWGGFIGALVASRGIPPILPTIGGTIAMYLVALCAYIYNDVRDLEADRINSEDRPLPSGRASHRQATLLVVSMGIVALVISLSLNFWVLAVTCFGLFLGYAYSTPPLSLKNRFLLKQTTTSLWASLSSLGGGVAITGGQITGANLYAAFVFFVYGMAFSPVVDIGDMAGDRAGGKRTLPLVKGPGFTIKMASTIMLSFVALTALTYAIFGMNLWCPILVGALSVVSVWSTWPLRHQWNDHSCCKRVVKKLILLIFALQGSLVVGVL